MCRYQCMEIVHALVALTETDYIFLIHSEEIFPMGTFFHVRETVHWIYEVVAHVCMLDTRVNTCTRTSILLHSSYGIFSRKLRHSLPVTILSDFTVQPRQENEFFVRFHVSIICYSVSSPKSFLKNYKHHNQQK